MKHNFRHLHGHCGFSFRDGLGLPNHIIDRIIEISHDSFATTNHGNCFSHIPLYREASKRNVKVIFGCEFYLCDDLKKEGVAKPKRNEFRHVTVLAKNQNGYSNLLALQRISYLDNFYYEPTISWSDLITFQSGLIVLSGCMLGHLSRLILQDKDDLAFKWAEYLKHHLESFYAEIIPCPGIEDSQRACEVIWQIAKELKIPLVLTGDAHFPRREDAKAQHVLTCINYHKKWSETDGKYLLEEYFNYCPTEEIIFRAKQALPHIPVDEIFEAANNAGKIADQCNVELPRSSGPSYVLSPGQNVSDKYLVNWVVRGQRYRRELGVLPDEDSELWETYLERERYEYQIIDENNFENYLLIVSDMFRYVRERGFLAVARGSCGGSLLCYYLGISQVDPIKFNLPVERFMDLTRKDLPDIDADLDSRYREEVFQYLRNKYGAEHCSQIAALSRFKARQAIRDVARVFEIPDTVADELRLLIPEAEEEGEDLKAVGSLARLFAENSKAKDILQNYPDLEIAAQLEGQYRTGSSHAAGFLIDTKPITETLAVCKSPNKPVIAQADKESAAWAGMLKLDVLSSDVLAVIGEVLELIGKDLDWLFALPLDDQETYRTLAKGKSIGVFQLQGTAATSLLKKAKVSAFEDIVAIGALARPGPLESGGAQEYLDRKAGISVPKYHPAIWDIVKDTLGVIVFQEQVMRVARELGDFPWEDVHAIRKLVSKSGGSKAMDAYKERYLNAAVAKGIPQVEADAIWVQCEKAGAYIFNKAHAVAYALTGYFTAYLKTHYPAQFIAVFAKYEKDALKQKKLFEEFRSLGGKFMLLDPNLSEENFTAIDNHTILGGFENLHGCGKVTGLKAVKGKLYKNWDDFYSKCPKVLRERLQATGIHTGEIDTDAALIVAPWWIQVDYNELEKKAFERFGCIPITSIESYRGEEIRLIGRLTGLEEINVVSQIKKYGGRMPSPGSPVIRGVLTITDETGSVEIYCNPEKYELLRTQRDFLRGETEGIGNTVFVRCKKSRDGSRLYGEDVVLVRQSQARIKPVKEEKPRKPQKEVQG